VTSVYVTHDQAEAFAIADWLVLMNVGRVEQQGRPEAVYRRPATTFAARFLGLINLLAGEVVAGEQSGAVVIATPIGRVRAFDGQIKQRSGAPVTVVLRPEGAEPTSPVAADQVNVIYGTVVQRSFRGSRTRLTLRHADGQELLFELDSAELPEVGKPIALELRPEAISLIPS
jgi:ABC-type Fe3+/spermidine/putrescine transport system ATPase subunit